MTNEESDEVERLARALSDFRFKRERRFLQQPYEFWDKHRDECRAFVKVILAAQNERPATADIDQATNKGGQ